MIDSIYHMTLNYLKIAVLASKHQEFAILYATLYGRHYVTLLNLYTPSGLSILLHGVISLPGVTSCDKYRLSMFCV